MVIRHVRLATAAVFGGFALGLVSCTPGVKPEELDAELAKVREEFRAGDDQLSGRIDQLDRRVSSLETELQALRNDFNVTMEKAQGIPRETMQEAKKHVGRWGHEYMLEVLRRYEAEEKERER